MLRALEPTYVRFILDADFERRLRLDDELAAAAGVNNADLERLRAIPAEALAVDRRGRWGSLWDRVRAQLPRTATHLEHWLTREELGALWYDYYSNEFWALDETIPLPPFGKGMEMATTMRLCLRRRAVAGGVGDQLAADLAELECHKFRVLCGVVPAGERAGAGSSDFDVFAVYDDPRLGPDEVRLQTTVRWMVDHTGGVSLLTTAQRGWDALTTSCDTQVQFEGYRLNLFHTSATCYYVMGRKAEEVLDVIRGLDQRRGAGELELTAEERGTLMQDGEGLILHPAYYFQETPSFFDDDTTLVWKRRDGESHYETALDREGLALFHRLLPALASNTVSLSTLRERLDDEEWEFLQRMLHHGYVVPAPLRAPAVRRDHRLTLIGHSGIVFESPSSRVMLDPLFLVRARRDYNPIPAVLSEPLDAVIISHPHWDHLNFDSLVHLHPETEVVIPRLVHRPSISNLDMARMLRDFGFTRIVELEPWQTARVGRGRDVEVTALPYYGESVGLAPRDWMTVHVALGGRQAVCLVDAARDPYGDADQVVQEARRRFGRPDFLFAPASEFHYPLVHFNRIPFYLDRCFEVFTGGPTDVVRWATFSGARLVIPYALFHLTPWDLENDDNACDADVFRRGRVSTLAQRMRAAPDGPLCVMAPGDRLTWGGDERPLGRDIGDGVRLVQVLRA